MEPHFRKKASSLNRGLISIIYIFSLKLIISHLLLFLIQLNMNCFFLVKCFCGIFQCLFLSTKHNNKAKLKVSSICSSLLELNNEILPTRLVKRLYDVINLCFRQNEVKNSKCYRLLGRVKIQPHSMRI